MAEKTNKKDLIREKILDTAQEVFTKYGFGKTTMEDIAREMGKGKSTIYYYFTSKEEIFRAVVEKELMIMRNRIMVTLAQKEDARDKLEGYLVERMKGLKNLKNLYNVIRSEFAATRELADQTRQQTDQEEIVIVSSILDKGVHDGLFYLEDTLLTSIAIVTALKGMEIPLVISGTDSDALLEKRLKRLLDVLFYGIIKREPGESPVK